MKSCSAVSRSEREFQTSGLSRLIDNAIAGAGSVVTKDIPANTVAVGNPAKVIKELDATRFQR